MQMPERVHYRGRWRLSGDHELALRSVSSGAAGTLEGRIIGADGNSLTLAAGFRDERGNDHLRTVKLAGCWQADSRNRLTFLVNKNKEEGFLVFRNGWELDRNRRIIYTYEDRRTGRRHRFGLEGHWRLDSSRRVAYVLEKGRALGFQCRLESLSLQPRKAALKFRVGAGISGEDRKLTFLGSWRFGRGLSIDFEAGASGSITLETRFTRGGRDNLTLALRDERRRPLGISLVLSRKLAADADAGAWLKLAKRGADTRIEAGISVPF